MLETIVYLSSAARDFDEDEIEPLLKTARRRNAENGLSGVLLYAEGSFIQVLEGETAALDETMARIQGDKRHGGVVEIFRAPIESKSFADWTMGYRNASLVYGEGGFVLTPETLEKLNNPGVGREVAVLLRQFYQTAYRYDAA